MWRSQRVRRGEGPNRTERGTLGDVHDAVDISQLAHKRLARAVRMHRLRRARNALPGECADSKQRPVLLRVLLRPSRLGKDGTHADNVRPVTGQLT